MHELQRQCAGRVAAGDDLDTINDEVIDPSSLGDMEKAALWLWTWCHYDAEAQFAYADDLLRGLPELV